MSDSDKDSINSEINFSPSSNESSMDKSSRQEIDRVGRTLSQVEQDLDAIASEINDLSISSDGAIVASSNRSITSSPSTNLFSPISNERDLPSRKSSKKIKSSHSRSESPFIRNRDQNLSTLNPNAVRMSEEGKFEVSREERLQKTKKVREKRKRENKKTQKKIKKESKQNKSLSSLEDLSDLSEDSGLDSDVYDEALDVDDVIVDLVDESPELYNDEDFERYIASMRDYTSNQRILERLNELVEDSRLIEERRDIIHQLLMEEGVDASYQTKQQDIRANKKRDRRGGKRKTRKNKNKKKGGGGDWGIFNPPHNWDENQMKQKKLEEQNRKIRNDDQLSTKNKNYKNRNLIIAKASGTPPTYSPLHSSGGSRRKTRKKYNYNKKNKFTRRK